MAKTLLTIVVPVYNAERDIARCLGSISSQTFRDYEVIVVDGNSSDGTLRIVQGFSNLSIKVISEPDNGVYDAMSKGIRIASGQWVYIMGADDAFVDDSVLRDFHAAVQDADADLVYGNVLCTSAGAQVRRSLPNPLSRRALFRRPAAWHQSLFAKTSLYLQFPFDSDLRIAADYDWLLRASVNSSARYIARDIAYYNMDGLSGRSRALLMRELRLIQMRHFRPRLLVAVRFLYLKLKGCYK